MANPNTVNIGTSPNDGTGDPIRDAFSKVNSNFDLLFTSFVADNLITVGNSTVNTVVSNTGGLIVSNSTVSTVANTNTFKIGNTTANVTVTTTSVFLGNATVNTTLNTTSLQITNSTSSVTANAGTLLLGNSTVNSSLGVSALQVSNSTSNVTANAGTIFVGNSTVNATVNSSAIKIASANVTTNTFTLGSSNVGSANFANGYSVLPNGLLMLWGTAEANTTGNLVTLATATGVSLTNVFSVSATSNTTAAFGSIVLANATHINVISSSTSATQYLVYWNVIGK